MTKPIPKSLHTVRVVTLLARDAKGFRVLGDNAVERSVDWAIEFLGYADTPDTHGIRDAVLKAMTQGKEAP